MWASRCRLTLTLLACMCGANSTFASVPRVAHFSPIFSIDNTYTAQRPTRVITYLLKTRGGSDVEDESEDFDDEEGVFDDFEMGDDGDDEFAEETMVDRFLEAYRKTPPLTKSYLTASFIVTTFGYMFNRNQFPDIFLLDWKKTLTRGQVWRPFTTFFNFGPIGLSYLLTVQFVWTYMSTLERLHHRKPYDFWIMIGFGMMSMVFGYPILKLNARFLGHNLSTFLVYMWSRYHEGMEVKLFDLYSTRAELLPWFFLAQTFLLEGEPPVLDFLGIVFGHVYHHCNTVGLLRAPESVVRWYKDSDSAKAIRDKYKEISTDFEVI